MLHQTLKPNMRSSKYIAFFHFFVFVLASLSHANLVNVDLKRIVDVGSTLEISKTTIRMENEGDGPASYFFLLVMKKDFKGLGDVWVSEPSTSKSGLHAMKMEMSDQAPEVPSYAVGYKVFFPKPLAPGAQITVDVRMDMTGLIKPVPDVIRGHESQYMLYKGDSYFFTPYHTKRMQATIILGSSDVSLKRGLIKPAQLSGKRLILGPYEDVPPLSNNEINVRCRNDRGFLVAKHALKEYVVSHWGTIATKEEFQLVNGAARFEGEWSRADYRSSRNTYDTALGDIWANLPPSAKQVVYKDLIGNVTSSRLRKPTKKKRPVQLTFRFPLMGGWRNHFWVTYDLDLSSYLSSSGSQHTLNVPIFPSLNTDLLCEELEVRILLPEGSHSIEILPHPSLNFDMKETVERTTMTLFGRPIITLRLNMTRSQSKHYSSFDVRYQYNVGLVWVLPCLAVACIFSLFVGLVVCMRNGLTLAEEQLNSQKAKEKTS